MSPAARDSVDCRIWLGRQLSLEDTACAGAIAHSVLKQNQLALEELAGNDELRRSLFTPVAR